MKLFIEHVLERCQDRKCDIMRKKCDIAPVCRQFCIEAVEKASKGGEHAQVIEEVKWLNLLDKPLGPPSYMWPALSCAV